MGPGWIGRVVRVQYLEGYETYIRLKMVSSVMNFRPCYLASAPRDDFGCASTELVYGTTLLLPGEFSDRATSTTAAGQTDNTPPTAYLSSARGFAHM